DALRCRCSSLRVRERRTAHLFSYTTLFRSGNITDLRQRVVGGSPAAGSGQVLRRSIGEISGGSELCAGAFDNGGIARADRNREQGRKGTRLSSSTLKTSFPVGGWRKAHSQS